VTQNGGPCPPELLARFSIGDFLIEFPRSCGTREALFFRRGIRK